MKAYPADDRTYLNQENTLFLILRTSFQTLAQLRLMRTQVHPKLGTLEQKIENLHISLNSQAHREHLITLINNIHEKLDKAENMRILTSDENLAKHNALISVCTAGSGDSYPFEDYENDVNDDIDDPRNTRAPRLVNPTEIVNSTPCPNRIDFTPFKKFYGSVLLNPLKFHLR